MRNDGGAKWDHDLAAGLEREAVFADVLMHRYIEQKRDFKYASTGNVAVEYQTSQLPDGGGRRWPSGISTTTSDWWAVEFIHDRWLVMRTDYVKVVARRAITEGRRRWVGDNRRFLNALIPMGWLVERPVRDITPQRAENDGDRQIDGRRGSG